METKPRNLDPMLAETFYVWLLSYIHIQGIFTGYICSLKIL